MAHVLITGASVGLGAALAEAFAQRGHDVGLVARREEALAAVAERARSHGVRAAAATADVTDPEALSAAVRQIEETLGPVDILVANAGVSQLTAATRWNAETVRWIMRVNFEGVVNAIDTVLPAMLARRAGQISAVSSPASLLPLPNQGAYSASKVAVTRLLETMAIELRPYGVSITVTHPGFMKTDLTAEVKHPMPQLMEVDYAAGRIADGVLKKRARVDFPVALLSAAKLGSIVPRSIYGFVIGKLNPVPRPKR